MKNVTILFCLLLFSVISRADVSATLADIDENIYNYSERTRVVCSDRILINNSLVFSEGTKITGLIIKDNFYFKNNDKLYTIPVTALELSSRIVDVSNLSNDEKKQITDENLKKLLEKKKDAYNAGWGWFAFGSVMGIAGVATFQKYPDLSIGCYCAGSVGYIISATQFYKGAMYRQKITDNILLQGGINNIGIIF